MLYFPRFLVSLLQFRYYCSVLHHLMPVFKLGQKKIGILDLSTNLPLLLPCAWKKSIHGWNRGLSGFGLSQLQDRRFFSPNSASWLKKVYRYFFLCVFQLVCTVSVFLSRSSRLLPKEKIDLGRKAFAVKNSPRALFSLSFTHHYGFCRRRLVRERHVLPARVLSPWLHIHQQL